MPDPTDPPPNLRRWALIVMCGILAALAGFIASVVYYVVTR